MSNMERWTKYRFPTKQCSHVVCDGEFCIVNPVPLRAIMEWQYVSCLYVPILGGFKRCSRENKPKRGRTETKIYYVKAVNKEDKVKLYNFEQVHEFLHKYELRLTVDLFSFNPKIDIKTTLDREKWFRKLLVEDISDGQELLQIPAVNLVGSDIPIINEYLMQSVFADEKTRNHPRRTNVCCDCTDGCRDKLNCACFKETLKCYNPDERTQLKKDEKIGYDFKMLQFNRQNMSGIYECNSKCQCNEHCINRVAQFPPKWKLQVFKDKNTEEKGWSVRTLNDIPAGAFVGLYTGEMFQETSANVKTLEEEWKSLGKWKYIVNLQVIQNADKESVKLSKPPIKPISKKGAKPTIPIQQIKVEKKGPPMISFGSLDHTKIFGPPLDYEDEDSLDLPSRSDLESRNELTIANQVETWDIVRDIILRKQELAKASTSAKLLRQQLPNEGRMSASSENSERDFKATIKKGHHKNKGDKEGQYLIYTSPNKTKYRFPANLEKIPVKKMTKSKKLPTSALMESRLQLTPRIRLPDIRKKIRKYMVTSTATSSKTTEDPRKENLPPLTIQIKNEIIDNVEIKKEIIDMEVDKPYDDVFTISNRKSTQIGSSNVPETIENKDLTRKRILQSPGSPRKTKHARLSLPISPRKFSPQKASTSTAAAAQRVKGKYSLRGTEKKNYTFSEIDTIFKKMPKKHSRIAPTLKCVKDLYLIDGYSKGNVGRYFNHSCDPNLFCQYVFVDTHDVRFPVVSFFAKKDIKAGTELTWSYNYDDDIDMGIVVECKCNAKDCRGILIA